MHDEEKPAGRIRWITHEGQEVLLVDLSYCSPQSIGSLVAQAGETIRSQPLGSVLVLADFTTVQFNPALFEKIKEVGALDRPHVKRSAWVGSQALSKAWFAAIRRMTQREFHRFETREEALTFLVRG